MFMKKGVNLERLAEFDFVLPDKTVSFENPDLFSLDNVYCFKAYYDLLEKENPTEKIILSKLHSSFLNEHYNKNMEKKYRSVRNQKAILPRVDYEFLITGASLATSGKNVCILSNDLLINSAYKEILNRNSYLNKNNFVISEFEE